ncbi:MAG TPA: tRNA (guanosine(46)-N7)-methyltransferase TrmB [Crocinitomix sp.]|nr:tRNA (guanosine(46)-N7)-methyltransferase TrmB [Crocinitomix sp.]
MAKNKLKHFADMKTMDFVFEPDISTLKNGSFSLKGKWSTLFFNNQHPIIIELGCGKGEYTVELAKKYPHKNFIGIDIKGARMWYGANEVREKKLKNVAFVRLRIDFILEIFNPNEVDEIWLTFSDPQKEKPRKRLTSKLFMDRFKQILKPNGIIHLKTDSDILFEFTIKQIEEHQYKCNNFTWNLYGNEYWDNLSDEQKEILSIKTNYEQIFSNKGHLIKYCQIKF